MLHCHQCNSFIYIGQSPHNLTEPVGLCEDYVGTEFYKPFCGEAEACSKFRARRGSTLRTQACCPTCRKPYNE